MKAILNQINPIRCPKKHFWGVRASGVHVYEGLLPYHSFELNILKQRVSYKKSHFVSYLFIIPILSFPKFS